MIISIGTKNKAKIQALEEALKSSSHFSDYTIISFAVQSLVPEQPISLEETILGAKNRAYSAFNSHQDSKYGFGIESGLMEAVGTRSGFFNISICCIFDGKEYYTGLSTGFEVPDTALKKILEENQNLTDACLTSGISSNQKLGEEEGIIGILTDQRVNRMEYSKECINMALIQVSNKSLYSDKLYQQETF